MKLEVFPPVYKTELEQSTKERIFEEKKRFNQQKDAIQRSVGSEADMATWIFGCGTVGFIIGFFTCVSNCNCETWGEILGPWIFWTIAGLVIGLILSAVINSNHNESVKEMQLQISREDKNSQLLRDSILKDAEKKYSQYVTSFESKAQLMSVQFAESQLAVEVIEWMTNGFMMTIDSSDRRSHIESINIPFRFDVYPNKIICNLGIYDFEIKRCRKLNSPLEQTALARAIASAIQLNITMKYQKDVSGTDVVTNIGYSYGNDYVSANIIYTSKNGNYRAVRDWTY